MKKFIILYLLSICNIVLAQKECYYDVNQKDSIGTIRTIKEVLMHEKIFGKSERYLFFSLTDYYGTPALNITLLEKNNDFIPTKCLDKHSKLHFQLDNGSIVMLMHINEEKCSSLLKVESSTTNTRALNGTFLFLKETFEKLKQSSINFLRIKFATENFDIILPKELISELDKKTYYPETFFKDYLHCILE
ncbi:MAG: hypothetical protein ACOVQ2_00790 [Flavobacterium sp.]